MPRWALYAIAAVVALYVLKRLRAPQKGGQVASAPLYSGEGVGSTGTLAVSPKFSESTTGRTTTL